MKVLVIANSARSIVCSAKKAGYTVFTLDCFGDVDTCNCSDKSLLFKTSQENELQELARTFGEADAVVLGPGYEKLKFKNVLSNPPAVMEEVSDKSKLPGKLLSMGIPHPETESIDKADGLGFPLMIKPKSGSGGMRNIIVKNEGELAIFKERIDASEFIAQEYIEGIPCSASVISSREDAVVVALNEQLIGVPGLPFAYCGNITPFQSKFNNEMIQYAKQIAIEFGLVGSNGVDFIQTEKGIVVIEVNPRFQGSMDTVEPAFGINIFDAHVKSFSGELPEVREPVCFAAKSIVYANKKTVISKTVSDTLKGCMEKGRAADIPQPGTVVSQDEPVSTMLATAKSRSAALENVVKSSRALRNMLKKDN
ncbi:MAG: ATP-grasp domain-containing protein [Candidatus Methanoperedens sp.]|nr:ATP-grasp domain-containing protein [Candidatus Methanoperedens sp.]